MAGFLQHLLLTLRLNLRSKQALAYGYLVPVFFLFAFGSIFNTTPPLQHEIGQLLTISALGGACFGMPTAMVAERERGVWRRYRLLPAATGGLIFSTMIARFFIVASAALLQIVLAMGIYKMPAPQHPVELAAAFVFVAYAFIGLGLVIAMLADTVPAVQALGQSIFLPMIIIGGVGVPLHILPHWAQHIAAFLPGLYSVTALQVCENGPGLSAARFDLLALVLIGAAGCLAGSRLFRWDAGQKVPVAARAWAALAIVPWVAAGVAAQERGRLGPSRQSPSGLLQVLAPAATQPATQVSVAPAAAPATQAAEAASQPSPKDWHAITDADIASVSFDNLEPDSSSVTPIAPDLDHLDADGKARIDDLSSKLVDWEPGQTKDVVQKVRNLLAVCAIPDVLQDQYEAYVPLVVFKQLQLDVPADDLPRILTWIIFHPKNGDCITKLDDLGWDTEVVEDVVRERIAAYATKFLGRLTGKLPRPEQ